MDENCIKCKEKVRTENSIKCSGICGKVFHLRCVEITTKDYNAAKNIVGFKWLCDVCISYLNFTMQLSKEFNDFKQNMFQELNELKNRIGCPTGADDVKTAKSYSSIVSGEAVVIKPKAKQDSNKTKEIVTKKLKPSAMEVGITQIKNVKDGGILIKCKTKEEMEKVKKEAEKSLGRQYQIKTPQQKNPCVKVVNIEEEMESNELIDCLKKQNYFLRQEDVDIKVVTIKKMVSRYMAILECDPKTHARILEEKSLCIGWTPGCRVFDYIKIFRCFKCGGFNHKAENCESQVCVKCGESDHTKENCQSDNIKCANCVDAVKKLNIDLNVNHSMFDIQNCTVLQRKVNVEKQKIKNNPK